MPRLEDWEIKKYWEIFQGLNPVSNKLTGEKVAPLLKNSRLQEDQLSKIWELSDIDSDGKLDFEEFCITMRLIYDMVNGQSSAIPQELPNWLVPSSKAHLIQANKAVQKNSNLGIDYEDDEDGLSDDFDWYISPTDKATYETIYNSNSDSYGRVKFESLNTLYNSLSKVPKSDISSAWNLVNPKSFETIDKDQVLVFLHILNQRENGKRIPRGVPASLRATFSKEVPTYDLNSVQSKPQPTSSTSSKKSFANDYLSKIGQSNTIRDTGTDFSSTQGTDWEEVRLRRELTDLENLLEKVQNGSKQSSNNDSDISGMLKYEFEQLLKFKQDKLSSAKSSNKSKDLKEVKSDIDDIRSQVTTLEEYLASKNVELEQINEQIRKLTG
ncbi:actin cytoskeleton-regulatory complex protein END3-domain-containing protein [Scheffersomyces xylosifermentans]|uniref:actin cytoskeleton-regulatory complex protein END3-domain-containing protein n=1 Tax=Scheffersomyces xylosifermentans TaxID=1304137 RepID=UPI00315DB80E